MAIKFLNNIDLGQNQLENARVHVASTAPVGSGKGSIWLNSTTNELNFHNGTTFVSVMDDTNTALTTFTLTADSGTDQTVSNGETLDIAGGSSITTSVGNTNTVTIQFLRSDGDGTFSWAVPEDTNTDTNTQNTYSTSIPSSTTKLRLSGVISGASNTTDDIEFLGSGVISVTRTDADTFTISSSAQANVATNLSKSTSETDVTVNSSTGSNIALGAASASAAGVMTKAMFDKLDGIENGATGDQTAAQIRTAVGTGNSNFVPAAPSSPTTKFLRGDGSFAVPSYISYSVGDGGLTQNNFTNADHSKLDGITAAATPTNTANVKSALNASFGGSATIGDGSDTFTIPGNLIVTGDTTTASETVKIVEDNTLQFEGAAGSTASTELNLTTAVLTGSDKTITLPNATGTVALTSQITGTNSGTNTGDQDVFKTIAVSGQSNVVADSATDTLTLAASGGMTITTSGDTITLSSANTQLNNAGVIGKVLTGLSTSTGGAVVASDTILAGFGKLEKRVALNDAKETNTDNNTQNQYSTSVISSSGIKLRLSGSGHNGNTTDDVKFASSGAASVSRTDASTITIGATNTTYTAGDGLDLSGTTFSIDKFEGALAAATSGIAKSQNTYTITHGLGSKRVNVQVTTTADPYEQVFPEINYASAAGTGTVLVIFGKTVSDSDYNVTITR